MLVRRLVDQRLPIALAIATGATAIIGFVTLGGPLWAKVALGFVLFALTGAGAEYQRRALVEELVAFAPRDRSTVTPDEFGVPSSAVARSLYPNEEPPYVARPDCDERIDVALSERRFV